MNRLTLKESAVQLSLSEKDLFDILIKHNVKYDIMAISHDLSVDERVVILTKYVFNSAVADLKPSEYILSNRFNGPITGLKKEPCVYFLIKDDKIVYVGKTTNILNRLNNHFDEKDFSDIHIDYQPVHYIDYVEMLYIQSLKPTLNVAGKNISSIVKYIINTYCYQDNPVYEIYADTEVSRDMFKPITIL